MTLAKNVLSSLNEMNDYYADGGQYYRKDDYNYAFESDPQFPNHRIHYITYDQRGWTIRTVKGPEDLESQGYKTTNHDQGTPSIVRQLRANVDWNGKITNDLMQFEEPRWRNQ